MPMLEAALESLSIEPEAGLFFFFVDTEGSCNL
jgi:hypothetical protein